MVNLEILASLVVTGLGLGALYSLVAIGFTLLFKSTNVLNFAQGQIALFGAATLVLLTKTAGLSLSVSFVLILGLSVLIGLALERLVFRHFVGEPILSIIIVTLALANIFRGIVVMTFGSDFTAYPPGLQQEWTLTLPFGTDVAAPFVIGVALALTIVVVLMAFFRYTVLGLSLRGSASNQQASMVLGISIERTIVLAWVLSIAITTLGGVLLGMSRGGVALGIEHVGIIIFAAVVFGGLDSIPGAFVGSLVVGLLEQLGTFYIEPHIGSQFGTVFPLVFLLFVILIKPYGILGTERIERL
jgi:branched-chain amino acid transport system permease protein